MAGRIAYLELSPLDVRETGGDLASRLWVRGGLPPSFLAESDWQSAEWREQFIRTYLERDVPQLGPRVPAETLRRLWTKLAHGQGNLLNMAALARSLAIDGKTVARYVDRRGAHDENARSPVRLRLLDQPAGQVLVNDAGQ